MKPASEQTYFSLFSIEPIFAVDVAALEQKYFALQRQYHPDRFVGKPEEERRRALNLSMQVNDAYHILKDPLKRAQYLLSLNGIQVNGEKDTIKPTQPLLIELMELREQLEEGDVAALAADVAALQAQTLAALERAFTADDLTAAAHQAIRLNYLTKLTRDIELARRDTSA